MKKHVIGYLHSHWDREWYREYEVFRCRLVRVFDNVLEMLEDNIIPSFYFDGQTAALLDYLEIRPEKEELVKKLVRAKKLFIGPFYCLVDEFLTDENCFRKNLELGLKTAREFGCEDFIGYFADTFGHSASTISILKEYGVNTAMVWRGCGDVPSEFEWSFDGNKINTINLIRGYFNDVFSTPRSMEEKAEFLKDNLDKISEKSGEVLLLPIGADHLGVEKNISEQINEINNYHEDYEIRLGSPFEYLKMVEKRFSQYSVEGELRDNSKTFILEGCYSSRLDIKQLNTKASYELELAENLVKLANEKSYDTLIDYAYKLLLKNQAHDSICGCSTDDVHNENIIRYKKISQIANTVIEEIRLKKGYNNTKIFNLSDKEYSGVITLKSTQNYPYQIIKTESGFDSNILYDTQKIPVTEDYTDIYTYLISCNNVPVGLSDISILEDETDVFVTDTQIGNSNIFLTVDNGTIKIGDKQVKLVDYKDNGDSYNTGYMENDCGIEGKILSSKVLIKGSVRSTLRVQVQVADDVMDVDISLDKNSTHLDFDINWVNTRKNHLLEFVVDTKSSIKSTMSEDFNNIIQRKFNPDYDVRANLPREKGKEVMANNAPMRRGVLANGIGIVTNGITQYEIYSTELRIPILRATGVISNPKNPARTTPAGPPIIVDDLQQLGKNNVSFSVFLGENLREMIDTVYHKCIVI